MDGCYLQKLISSKAGRGLGEVMQTRSRNWGYSWSKGNERKYRNELGIFLVRKPNAAEFRQLRSV